MVVVACHSHVCTWHELLNASGDNRTHGFYSASSSVNFKKKNFHVLCTKKNKEKKIPNLCDRLEKVVAVDHYDDE